MILWLLSNHLESNPPEAGPENENYQSTEEEANRNIKAAARHTNAARRAAPGGRLSNAVRFPGAHAAGPGLPWAPAHLRLGECQQPPRGVNR